MSLRRALLPLTLALTACFSPSSGGSTPDASFADGEDFDSPADSGSPEGAVNPDATMDSPGDAPADSATDATLDAPVVEAGSDAPEVDAGTDASEGDAGIDAQGVEAGTVNYALQFDDTLQPEYVLVADTTLLNVAASFTMEAWVNVTGPGHTGTSTILAEPYGGGQLDTSTIWLSSSNLYAAVNLGGTAGAVSSAWPFADGTWHHVAWTYDGSSQQETLFVDAVSVAQVVSTAGVPLYDGHPLLIGADLDNGGVTFGLAGAIDDVRIFSAIRTAGQIGDDMALVSPVGDPTLVAYYTFDEGAGMVAHDSSGNHLDGTLGALSDAGGASPTWIPSTVPTVGPPADAGPAQGVEAGLESILQFAPTDCVTVADNAAIDVGATLSYEVWINPVDGVASGIYSVVGKPYGSGAADSAAIWFQNGTLYASVNGASTAGALSFPWSFAADTWHHVAFTYASAGAATLYVDGASVATATSSAGMALYDTNPFLMGADIDFGAYEYGFLGFIREVRLFSAVRSPSQIASDMAGASPVGDPTLIAYYPLNEGSGTVAHDLSANHLDGQFGALDGGVASPHWVSAPGPF